MSKEVTAGNLKNKREIDTRLKKTYCLIWVCEATQMRHLFLIANVEILFGKCISHHEIDGILWSTAFNHAVFISRMFETHVWIADRVCFA